MDAVDVVDELFVAQASGGLRAPAAGVECRDRSVQFPAYGLAPEVASEVVDHRVCLVRGWSSSFAKTPLIFGHGTLDPVEPQVPEEHTTHDRSRVGPSAESSLPGRGVVAGRRGSTMTPYMARVAVRPASIGPAPACSCR